MKKLATAIFIWLFISASHAAEKINTVPDVQGTVNYDFKRVILTGNTVVYFVQSNKEEITIDEGDPRDISVIQMGNKLRINSNQIVPVTITIYYRNIFRIEAFDQVIVRSAGTAHLANLQILLNDGATGRFKAITNSLYTLTKGQSKLELLGKTDCHISAGIPNLDVKKFSAQTTEENGQAEVVARWESDYIR